MASHDAGYTLVGDYDILTIETKCLIRRMLKIK
jgi:hypothetical protein